MIQVDLQNVRSFIPLPYEAALSPRLRIAHDRLQTGSGAGGEFTGGVRPRPCRTRQETAPPGAQSHS